MKIVVYNRQTGDKWESAVRKAFPDADVRQWKENQEAEWLADYGVIWQPPIEFFENQTALKAVFNQGVGVDHLVNMKGLPEELPIYKLRGVGMEKLMSEYVAYGVMHFYRNFDVYRQQQEKRLWKGFKIADKSQWTVGILGLGTIGKAVATHIRELGFPVCGWSRSPKDIEGVRTFTGNDGLSELLKQSRVLVSLLPATESTYRLLNHESLAQLPEDSVLINGGRGSVIDLEAVQNLLDTRHLRGVVLDVFEKEPLDENHPLWQYEQVIITPHISAPTPREKAMEQIAAYIEQFELGVIPEPIDRSLGY
ncbi:2-hydroxyacid dehydrogenase [Endozoicomonas lisbonensis]|uniref:Glyoxylate/hydroxypyruvate reductase A n=1 Tax=Endozoicomonas lisbonensis TaxID=3120522 RepID=A0ABV2SIN0_9GAMM